MNMMSKVETEALAAVKSLGGLISRHERTHTSSTFRKVMAYIVGGGTAALTLLGFILVAVNGGNWNTAMVPWVAAALGVIITWSGIKDVIGTNDASFALFEQGVAFQTKKGLVKWKWEEVRGITVNLVNVIFNGVSRLERRVTLTSTAGATLAFGNGVRDPDAAIRTLKQHIYARVFPPLLDDFAAGRAVSVGSIRLDPHRGIQLVKTMLPWDKLKGSRVHDGLLVLVPTDGPPTAEHRKPVGEIANVDLLIDLVDRRLSVHQS